ncbi:hypothetical protein [Bradyrhizobium sp. UFLA05-112]
MLAFSHGNKNAKLLKGHPAILFHHPKPTLIPNKRDRKKSVSFSGGISGGLAVLEFNRFYRLKHQKLLVGSIAGHAPSSLASKPDEGNLVQVGPTPSEIDQWIRPGSPKKSTSRAGAFSALQL